MKTADRVVPVLLLGIGIFVFWQASEITFFSDELLGPAFFPKFLAGLIILLGLLLFVRTFFVTEFPSVDIDRKGLGKIALVIMLNIVYLLTIETIGFLITTPILMFALMMLLKRGDLVNKIIFSTLFPLAAWIVFKSFLKIPLPRGLFD
ncbi:hypothetical protein CSB45_11225 [candidate division KSB3 bacterium]|uniref:DUF1468 domain-containing protein n=1 Tax=candidate division KSB3 bacterium TaxID=2044937 RepID=A0A2G6E2Y4_9BACT|nr:MAG: hypothetical protein CSB45_11225 [candidate division KSB3 bacterium]PIE28886.1 MAG: hypothetical protein CSA57_11275 [candidate division KSB3 bacterium]